MVGALCLPREEQSSFSLANSHVERYRSIMNRPLRLFSRFYDGKLTFFLLPAFVDDVDVVPLLSSSLALLHAAFFIPLVISEVLVESTDYDCRQKAQIQAGIIGSLSLYAVSILLECVITAVGLRGGPFEIHKRKWVAPLLYVEFSMMVLAIIITSWNTYLVQSDSISASCWSDNPCKYAYDLIPAACTSGASEEDYQLTEQCANVLHQEKTYGSCFDTWLDYASTW
jgi:hypothetical protein